jgi:hypothetical protein
MGSFEDGFNATTDEKHQFVVDTEKPVFDFLLGGKTLMHAIHYPETVISDQLWEEATICDKVRGAYEYEARFILGVVARSELVSTGLFATSADPTRRDKFVWAPSKKLPKPNMTVMEFEQGCLETEKRLFDMQITEPAAAKSKADKKLEKVPFEKALIN